MAEIVVAGELLAEFVAARRGQGFAEPGEFTGPFPSGAPAIFAERAIHLAPPSRIMAIELALVAVAQSDGR